MTTALHENIPMIDPDENLGERLDDPTQHIGGIITAAEMLSSKPEIVRRVNATGKVTSSRTPTPGGDSLTDYDTEESD